jgi:glycosyltransferase involved in cell wall biosynthesis
MALEEGEPYKAMKPKVSICVPNLNTRPFLPERFETIFSQSFQDWELLVYDSYSEDGSWEYIQELAAREERMRIWQGPRQGTPGSWNPCIHAACGEFVYVATSDDTMAPDCLQKLVAALEQHKDCGLAHCPLVHIDETGRRLPNQDKTVFDRSAGELINQPHIRRAPYDGLLPLTGKHVYFSFTQLLIRRSLFEQIGPLESRWGAIGDFNWYMRAGLVSNTVHVPDTWATLRVHPKSATQGTQRLNFFTPEYYARVEDMILDAVRACEKHIDPSVLAGLNSHWMNWARELRAYNHECLRLRRNGLRRRLYQMVQLFTSSAVRRQIVGRLFGKPDWQEAAPAEIRRWLESLGLGPMIVPAQARAADRVERLSNSAYASAS